jgi:molybdenum-dependent DNA-binding transcriptional regulator ModE
VAAALTDEQIERLHLEYAQTGSYRAASRAVGVSVESARKYLKAGADDPDSPLGRMRTQKKVDVAAKMGDLQIALIDALMSSEKISKASYQELATTLGITTEKRLLIMGQPTSRNENITADPSAKLTPDEMEAAARIRAKLAAEAS